MIAVVAAALVVFSAAACGRSREELLFLELDATERSLLASGTAKVESLDAAAAVADKVVTFGPEPYRILEVGPAASGTRARYLVLLRNQSEIALTDAWFTVLDHRPAPRSPTGWALVDGRYLFVCGELSATIRLYAISDTGLRPMWDLELAGVATIRDLAFVPEANALFLVDDFDSRLLRVTLPPGWRQAAAAPEEYVLDEVPLGHGAIEVRHLPGHLAINLLLDHTLLIVPLADGAPDLAGAARIVHDGPIWSFATLPLGDSMLVAVGGVEDRPLDRTHGEFGYVDSFLFLYRLPLAEGAGGTVAAGDAGPPVRPRDGGRPSAAGPERIAALNLSALGIVTPKAMRFEHGARQVRGGGGGGGYLWVTGFGAERMARLRLSTAGIEVVATYPAPAGITDFLLNGGPGSESNGAPESEGNGRRESIGRGTPQSEADGMPRSLVATSTLIDRICSIDLTGSGTRAGKPASTDLTEASARWSYTPLLLASETGPRPEPGAATGQPIDVRLGEALFFTTLMSPHNRTEGELSRFTCETCHFEGAIDGRTHFTGRDNVYATTKPLRGLANNVPLFSRAGDAS
ncbi:MAG: hypothetical protein ACE5HV_17175, partial [Acidobacteriota bacterium]